MAESGGPRVLVCRSVGRYIRSVRWSGLRCPGENRARRESGAPDVMHRPLVEWSMASAIGQGMSWFAGFVYAEWYSRVRLGTDGYGRIRLGSVRVGYVRWQRCPGAQSEAPDAEPSPMSKADHGAPIRRRTIRDFWVWRRSEPEILSE